MAKTGTLTIRVLGDVAPLRKSLGDTDSFLGKWGGRVAGAGAAAFAAVGAAAVGAAGAGIAAFTGFQKGMNEVFTLLPGISGDAMDSMKEDVKKFAGEFGVLPDEVIPSLYSALSAGVPQDNVFEFLETAQRAAVGGVTDLETAVDGISSVVNAFGSDVISAAEASDLMFTAVKGGKTTFGELSSSMFNVAPIASSLGVGFGEVTAGLAALTATGTPTAVASTQIRAALAELGKAGTKASDAFFGIAQQSFPDFIASGGTLQEALGMLNDEAVGLELSVLDMFGSVEAGQAALTLTGQGAEKFAAELEAAGTSAGATEAAFEQMETGIGPVFDKLRAKGATALLDIGDALAPFVEKIGNLILDHLPKFQKKAGEIFNRVRDVVEEWWPVVKDVFDSVVSAGRELWDAFKEVFDAIKGALGSNEDDVAANAENAQETFRKIGEFLVALKDTVVSVLGNIAEFWREHGDTIVEQISGTWNSISGIIGGVVEVITGIVEVIGGIFRGDWSAVWDGFKGIVEGVLGIVEGVIDGFINTVAGFFAAFGVDLPNSWSEMWEGIKGVVRGAVDWIVDKINGIIRAVNDVIEAANKLPGVEIPTVSEISTGGSARRSRNPGRSRPVGGGITAFAEGGIVTRPTLGLVGEAGPEAIIPLNRANVGGRPVTVNVNANVVRSDRELEELVQEALSRVLRRGGTVAVG